MAKSNKKIFIFLPMFILALATFFYFVVLDKTATTDTAIKKNSASDQNMLVNQGSLAPQDKGFYTKRGTIVDIYGDPIQDHIELYLDPVPDTGVDMEARRLTFKIEVNGGFEFRVDQLGAYNLSFQEGWYSDQMDTINPIDFRKMTDGYRIVVHNKEHDEMMSAKYTEEVQYGDTLWSMAEKHYGQGYFWPLIARANNLTQTGGMPKIFPGDKLVITPPSKLSQTDIEAIRLAFHAGNFGDDIVIINKEFDYSITYPGRWTAQSPISKMYDKDSQYYDNWIYLQKIIGPEYRKEFSSNKWLSSGVGVFIYDNRGGKNFNDFVIEHKITEESLISDGFFRTKQTESGGILITDGYYGDGQHLIFFKDSLIYDLVFSPINFVEQTDPVIADEIKTIIYSFKFTK